MEPIGDKSEHLLESSFRRVTLRIALESKLNLTIEVEAVGWIYIQDRHIRVGLIGYVSDD